MLSSRRPLSVVTGRPPWLGAATIQHLAARGHELMLGYLGDRAAADQVIGAG